MPKKTLDSSADQAQKTQDNSYIDNPAVMVAGFCVLGGVAAVATRGRGGPQALAMARRGVSRTVSMQAKAMYRPYAMNPEACKSVKHTPWRDVTKRHTKFEFEPEVLKPVKYKLQGDLSKLSARSLSSAAHRSGESNQGEQSGQSWTKWFKRLGGGLVAATGLGAYGFSFHSEDSYARKQLCQEEDLSGKLAGVVALSSTGLVGRFGQTDLGYKTVELLNETLLGYTSPLLQFEENKYNGKRVCYFRGEKEFEALEILNGKPRVSAFYAFYLDEPALPRVYHSGLEHITGGDNPGGFSNAVTSLTADFDVADGFNKEYVQKGESMEHNQVTLICAPKRIATTSTHQSREWQSNEREVVVTGLRREDVVGYLRVSRSKANYAVTQVEFYINPYFDGDLKDVQFDAQMLSLLEKVSDSNPMKAELLALVEPNFDTRQMFDETMPVTEHSMVLRAQGHFANTAEQGSAICYLYGFFGSSPEARERYQQTARGNSQFNSKDMLQLTHLHDDESHESVERFRSADGQAFHRNSEQLGSNRGGFFKDSLGDTYYIKYRTEFEENAEQIFRSEHVATKLYGLFGLKTPEVSRVHFMKGGKVYCGVKSKLESTIVSYWGDDDDEAGWSNDSAFLRRAAEGSLVDIWLGNYDVIGLGFDNLHAVRDVAGQLQPFRLDTGAALGFRAQGAREPSFNASADDFDVYFDKYESTFGECFKGLLTDKTLLSEAITKLEAVSDEAISQVIYKENPCVDHLKTHELYTMLIKRRENLLERAKEQLHSLEQEKVASCCP